MRMEEEKYSVVCIKGWGSETVGGLLMRFAHIPLCILNNQTIKSLISSLNMPASCESCIVLSTQIIPGNAIRYLQPSNSTTNKKHDQNQVGYVDVGTRRTGRSTHLVGPHGSVVTCEPNMFHDRPASSSTLGAGSSAPCHRDEKTTLDGLFEVSDLHSTTHNKHQFSPQRALAKSTK